MLLLAATIGSWAATLIWNVNIWIPVGISAFLLGRIIYGLIQARMTEAKQFFSVEVPRDVMHSMFGEALA